MSWHRNEGESCISLSALEDDNIQISVWNSRLPMATANALALYVGLTSNIVSRPSLGSVVIIRALKLFLFLALSHRGWIICWYSLLCIFVYHETTPKGKKKKVIDAKAMDTILYLSTCLNTETEGTYHHKWQHLAWNSSFVTCSIHIEDDSLV